jgi:RNA polymerase sigma factor (sigma-70 family)
VGKPCLTQKRPSRGYTSRREEIEPTLERLRVELLAFYRTRLPDPQEAEDFVQRSFERLLTKSEIQNTRALIFEISKGLLKNEYRDRQTQPDTLSWEQLVGEDGTGLDGLAQFQTMSPEDAFFGDAFDQAVRDLDPDPRDAFILGELRGLPAREAAPILGTSFSTAARHRAAATTYIRKELTA